MGDKIHIQPPLVPLKSVTIKDLKNIRIGEDFNDLPRLGLIGRYYVIDATDTCPRLYYRWNHRDDYWEIYAVEHDLIGYNLGSITEIKEQLVEVKKDIEELESEVENSCNCDPDEPSVPDTPDTPEVPTEHVHSTISRDPELIGGNLEVIIDKGLMILGGRIKYYCGCHKFLIPGNYVGCMITPDPIVWSKYKDTVKVEYRGRVFGSEAFDKSGRLILYPLVKVPGQEIPINITWTDEFKESFIVAITQESILCK